MAASNPIPMCSYVCLCVAETVSTNTLLFSVLALEAALFFFFLNVYLFVGQRETEHEQERGRERGRHRIGNRLQALSHQPRA